MYVGLGQLPNCAAVTVPAGFVGPVQCEGDPTLISAGIDVSAAAPKPAGFKGWLNSGNNALWLGAGVFGAALLVMFTGRR